MISRLLIDDGIPIIGAEDTVESALAKMDDHKFTTLPLVSGKKLVTLLREEQLLEQLDDQQLVKELPTVDASFVSANAHWFEAVSVFKRTKFDIVPVLDEEMNFLGCIKSLKLLEKFSQMLAFGSLGAILVLQIEERSYSLSDISRIVESNGCKLVTASLFQDEEVENLTYLVVKLDSDEASRVVAGLERFNYKILYRFQNSFYQDADQERLNQFLRYINF